MLLAIGGAIALVRPFVKGARHRKRVGDRLMDIGLGHYLTVAAFLFTLGIFGIFLNRKNVIVILMSIELMLLAVNINLVAFSTFLGDLVGQVFALFVLTVAAGGSRDRPRHRRRLLPQPRHHRGRRHQHDEGVSSVAGEGSESDADASPSFACPDAARARDQRMIYQAIVFLPLLGALIAGFFGRVIGPRPSEIVTTAFMVLAAVLSWVAFWQVGFGHATDKIPLLRWVTSGDLDVSWAIRVDTLTAVMLVVVNTVSALVHLYSIGYMHEDPHRPRFFAYLSLFTFAMLMLVTATTSCSCSSAGKASGSPPTC